MADLNLRRLQGRESGIRALRVSRLRIRAVTLLTAISVHYDGQTGQLTVSAEAGSRDGDNDGLRGSGEVRHTWLAVDDRSVSVRVDLPTSDIAHAALVIVPPFGR